MSVRKNKLGAITFWFAISAIVVMLDQCSKAWVLANLREAHTYSVVPHFNLFLTYNKGIAFSMFANSGDIAYYALCSLSIIIVLLLTFMQYKTELNRYLLHCAIAFIIGGAIGNLFDKILLGHVVDFIDFYWGGWHFAVFNLADSFISIGGALFLLDTLIYDSAH
ncbi:MAG: signal peptidase II [Legionellales bacterium]|nr:signal peptidase II [Legionellales bacterium]